MAVKRPVETGDGAGRESSSTMEPMAGHER
jgi:hypothetical protein